MTPPTLDDLVAAKSGLIQLFNRVGNYASPELIRLYIPPNVTCQTLSNLGLITPKPQGRWLQAYSPTPALFQ